MDIRGWVYGLVDIFPGALKTVARSLADRLFGIWDDVSGVFRNAIPRWRSVGDAIAWFTLKAMWAVNHLAVLGRQIVTERIPRAAEALRQAVVAWVTGIVNDINDAITSTRDWVLDKARGFATAVYDFAYGIYKWAADRLGEVWSTLSTVARLVDMLLTDPTKLATWAIGAIWSAFWRYADQHIDAIVEFVWQRRSIVVSRLLDRAETILERLL